MAAPRQDSALFRPFDHTCRRRLFSCILILTFFVPNPYPGPILRDAARKGTGMNVFTPDKIRNLALTGHGAAGKTSLPAAMLFNAGVTSRLTKVDKGNTVTDYESEELSVKFRSARPSAISNTAAQDQHRGHAGILQLSLGYAGLPAGRGWSGRSCRCRRRRRGSDGKSLGHARGIQAPPDHHCQQNGPGKRPFRSGRAGNSAVFRTPGHSVQIPLGEEKISAASSISWR